MIKRSVLLLLALSLPVQALPVYRVGVENLDYSPYSEVRDGQYSGLHRELLDTFAEQAGVRFEYVPLPYLRSVKEFLAGRIDFQYPDDPDWLPKEMLIESIHYSDPAIPYVDGVSQRPEQLDKALEQLDSLGTIIGFTTSGYLARIRSGELRLSQQPHVQGLIHQVLRQRLDGIYLNILVVAHQQRRMGYPDQLRFNPNLPHRVGYYRLSSMAHPELVEQFNRFLQREAQWLEQLKRRYGVSELLPPLAGLCHYPDSAAGAGQIMGVSAC